MEKTPHNMATPSILSDPPKWVKEVYRLRRVLSAKGKVRRTFKGSEFVYFSPTMRRNIEVKIKALISQNRGKLLWDSYNRGTYIRAIHGPLKTSKSNQQ